MIKLVADIGINHDNQDESRRIEGPKVIPRLKLRSTTVITIHPEIFLRNMLEARKCEVRAPALHSKSPTLKQLNDYTSELLVAVRKSNLDVLRELVSNGCSVNACNKFCESILHTACRRSTAEVIRFLLENDADVHVIDDYGRTALHDACWRTEPDFRIVSLLMDQDANLIHLLDSRNFTPLKYIREEHWLDWCRFLYMKKDDYWPLPFKGQLEYPIV